METYRYGGHGMSDVDRAYRTREEEQEWKRKRDPIDRLGRTLIEEWHLKQDALDAISSEVATQIEIAIEAAQKAPLPAAQELMKHVYAE
jgi:pyruvate dehydrogenase E1 component alpha subunit